MGPDIAAPEACPVPDMTSPAPELLDCEKEGLPDCTEEDGLSRAFMPAREEESVSSACLENMVIPRAFSMLSVSR